MKDYINRLMMGDVFFISFLDDYEKGLVISYVKNSCYLKNILSSSYSSLKDMFPDFLFFLCYDREEYKDFCLDFLKNNINVFSDNRFFHNFIGCSSWSVKYVENNLEDIIQVNDDNIFSILRYAIYSGKMDWVEKLAFNANLSIRSKTMIEIVDNFRSCIVPVYGDITKHFVDYNEDGSIRSIMKEEDLSRIASSYADNDYDKETFLKIKEFIFENYEFNGLAKLLDNGDDYGYSKEALLEDVDRFFLTSSNYKWVLFLSYRKYLSERITSEYEKYILPLAYENNSMYEVFSTGLGDKFLEFVKKYIALSTRCKELSYLSYGSCTSVFRVGDYVVKYSDQKWSYEEEICPRSFMIIKNLEEVFVRDENNYVTGAVEVQQCLSKPVMDYETDVAKKFAKHLAAEGYYVKDRLIDGSTGPNCYRLDSYLDADCDNPEELPEWFKKDPVVLTDRDLVFRLSNTSPRIINH